MAAEPPDQFGPNDWLVDELYQQFLQDRNSVDPAWWDFFAGFTSQDAQAVITPSTPLLAATPTPIQTPSTDSDTRVKPCARLDRRTGRIICVDQ